MGVHGPVVYKRAGAQGEIDVRLRMGNPGGNQPVTRNEVLAMLVSPESRKTQNLDADSYMKKTETFESTGIRREDRRRTASITISTGPADPRRVKKRLQKILDNRNLPPGYSIEFDPEAIRQAEMLSGTVILFLLAILFCYMFIAAANESFVIPLTVLAAIPPSLAVPVLCFSIAGVSFNSEAACAFVAVSGIAVNAAVLCAGGMERLRRNNLSMGLYRILRKKLPALLATSATTIAGALPFLLLREGGNTLIRTLSLVTALGVAASSLCSISVVPALFIILRKFNTNIISLERNSACAETKFF
jgi:multidrug efflux pump subunit AcrB